MNNTWENTPVWARFILVILALGAGIVLLGENLAADVLIVAFLVAVIWVVVRAMVAKTAKPQGLPDMPPPLVVDDDDPR